MNLDNIRWMKEGSIDLLVESYSSSALVLQIRGLNENEMIIADHTTTSNRSLKSEAFAITAPPRLLTVRAASTGVERGACFVRISLRVEGVVMATLFADYVTDTSVPAYPNGAIKSSIEGPGLFRSITGTNPAAGAEITETVPTNALWRLYGLNVSFTADATVATRQAIFEITDGANAIVRTPSHVGMTAGLGYRVQFGNYGTQNAITGSATYAVTPLDIRILAGYVIRTSTVSLQAGDDYGTPQYYVEEWINP